ncbi:hypothetical protein BDV93DRAFT_163538 [Ceratobasidium sp. AG-I]|nr:hypothetical protein BDV93DRAFT_163538 [Ceratobasidium sp. AG-I]
MTTHSSLSALLSQDDVTIDRSLDSHARFLASQIHASDTRRAWVDDIAHQLDTLDHPPLSPLGLSQSLPDSPTMFYDRMRAAQEDVPQARPRRRDGGLQQGDRPRSPPPRCMTQYTTAEAHGLSDNPDSILMPSTNGLRAAARVHGFVPLGAEVRSHSRRSSGSRNHSRKSSVQWDDDTEREGEGDGMFARQQSGLGWGRGMGSGTPVSPRSVSGGQMHSPRRSLSLYTHSPHASTSSQASAPGPAFNVYQHGNLSSPQLQSSPRRTRGQSQSQSQLQASREQYASHQPSTPVQPVLSAASAAPSTPAYNLLSAIAMRSPNGNSSDGGGTVRARGGSLSIADLTSPLRTTSQSDLGIGIRGQSDLGALVQRRPGIGFGVGRVSTGLRRARSATPTSRGNARPAIVSPVKRKPNLGGGWELLLRLQSRATRL